MKISAKKENALDYSKASNLFVYRNGEVIRRVTVSGGASAGTVLCANRKKGYFSVGIEGETYKLHRIVWLLNNKEWETDDYYTRTHITCNPSGFLRRKEDSA